MLRDTGVALAFRSSARQLFKGPRPVDRGPRGRLVHLGTQGASRGRSVAGDLSRQVPPEVPLEVRVQLGDDKGGRRFIPARIEIETGKLYRLILSNPSPERHCFSFDAFACRPSIRARFR